MSNSISACDLAGDVGGAASSMAAHILGYSGRASCPHAPQKAIAEATKSQASTKARKDGGTAAVPVTAKRSHATANANAVAGSSSSAALRPSGPAKKQKQGHFEVISKQKSTYEPDERAAIEMQATRAIISTGSPFGLFEDVEMKKLFDMIRDGTGDIMPSRKVSGGKLLNTCAAAVENELKKVFVGQEMGAS
jgi:hypothetical protein